MRKHSKIIHDLSFDIKIILLQYFCTTKLCTHIVQKHDFIIVIDHAKKFSYENITYKPLRLSLVNDTINSKYKIFIDAFLIKWNKHYKTSNFIIIINKNFKMYIEVYGTPSALYQRGI